MGRNGEIVIGDVRRVDGAVRRALDGGGAPGGAVVSGGARRFNCLTAGGSLARPDNRADVDRWTPLSH